MTESGSSATPPCTGAGAPGISEGKRAQALRPALKEVYGGL